MLLHRDFSFHLKKKVKFLAFGYKASLENITSNKEEKIKEQSS